MLYVSCRKNRFDDYRFTASGEHLCFEHQFHPAAIVPGENIVAKAPPPVTDLTPKTYREVVDRAMGIRVLVLVHGYRNPFWNVARAYTAMEQTLAKRKLLSDSSRLAYQLIVGYLWPARKMKLEFSFSVAAANRAALRHFRFFLADLSKQAAAVDVQTHSLGARVALGAIQASTQELSVNNLMLTAAAVDNESLEKNYSFYEATRRCRQVFNYHSRRDTSVRVAYRFGDAPEFDCALGCEGTQNRERLAAHTPNAVMIDCADHISDHGGYRYAEPYYDHWESILRERTAFPQFGYLEPRIEIPACREAGAALAV